MCRERYFWSCLKRRFMVANVFFFFFLGWVCFHLGDPCGFNMEIQKLLIRLLYVECDGGHFGIKKRGLNVPGKLFFQPVFGLPRPNGFFFFFFFFSRSGLCLYPRYLRIKYGFLRDFYGEHFM
jgi:hypothetical protein